MAAETTTQDASKKSRSRAQIHRPTDICFGTGLSLPYLEHKSSSEPELNSSFKNKQEQYWATFNRGFPPGVTVDELAHYRRRRPAVNARPLDNLHPEEGSLKLIKSEYKRRFLPHQLLFDEEKENGKVVKQGRRRRPNDELRLEGEAYFRPEYHESFVDFPRERPRVRRPRPQLTTAEHDVLMESTTEKKEKFVLHPSVRRPPLARKQATLKTEGTFLVKESEKHSKFIKFEDFKRSEPVRRPSNLKMEGEIDLLTENLEKFVKYTSPERQKPIRRSSNLRLDGVMEKLTEIREKYIQFISPKRAELRKRPTSLHLEGQQETSTEKNEKYIEFRGVKRPEPIKRSGNLQLDGDLEFLPEYRDFFIDFPRARPIIKRPLASLKPEGEFQSMTEKRSQYVDYLLSQYGRPQIAMRPSATLKLEGEFNPKPEYQEMFIDFPRERPKLIKQETNLKIDTNFTSNDTDFSRSKPHPDSDKLLNQPPSDILSEGRIETNPEYRSSFLDISRGRSLSRRPLEQDNCFSDGELMKKTSKRSHRIHRSARKLGEESWRGGSVHGILRPKTSVPESPERAAFRIIERTTGDRGEKLVSFNLSEAEQDKRQTFSPNLNTIRASSPSYRLLVDPVDTEVIRDDFSSQRHIPSSSNPVPITQRTVVSPQPPTVGFSDNYVTNNNVNESFIVLDDFNNNDVLDSKNRLNQRYLSSIPKSDFLDIPKASNAGVRKTAHNINWMPPWYDASTSI